MYNITDLYNRAVKIKMRFMKWKSMFKIMKGLKYGMKFPPILNAF